MTYLQSMWLNLVCFFNGRGSRTNVAIFWVILGKWYYMYRQKKRNINLANFKKYCENKGFDTSFSFVMR